jgi:hypothetical protein
MVYIVTQIDVQECVWIVEQMDELLHDKWKAGYIRECCPWNKQFFLSGLLLHIFINLYSASSLTINIFLSHRLPLETSTDVANVSFGLPFNTAL